MSSRSPVLLAGLAAAALSAPAPARADNPVRLVDVVSSQCPPAACYRDTFLRGTIEVENLAYEKVVGIVYLPTYFSSEWQTAYASYAGPSTAGKELWKLDVPEAIQRFAVFYTVAGHTYWDNNGGADYSVQKYEMDALMTYPNAAEAQGARSADGASLTGTLLIKNLGYSKQVVAVYTDDGWATVKEAPASWLHTFPSGVEWWTFELPLAAGAPDGAIRMAFEYTFPGGVDWDNDYGHDYRVSGGAIVR